MAKTYTLFVCCLLLCAAGMAQSFNYIWTRTGTGAARQAAIALATDQWGNAYQAGYFGDTVNFGALSAIEPHYSLNSFLVKYSPGGNPLWLGTANLKNGTQNANAQAAATKSNGDVLIAGSYSGDTVGFGTHILPETNGSNYYMFIAEYDSVGNVLWAKAATTNGGSTCLAMATDAGDNIYAAGFYSGDSVALDSLTLYNANYPGGRLIYLVKYNAAGTVQWAGQANPNSYATIEGVATDAWGNVYISGFFTSDSLSFGGETVYNTQANDEIFLFKLNPQGQALWAKGFAGDGNDEGTCVATDYPGNVYLAGGYASDSLNFGSGAIYNHTLNSDPNAYVTKFDSSGNNLWTKTGIATGLNEVRGLTIDISNNVYISGEFVTSNISFDSTVVTVPAYSQPPTFMAVFDSAGKVLTATSINTANQGQQAMAADKLGNVYAGGTYGFNFGIDTLVTGADTTYGNPGYFVYLLKINNHVAPPPPPFAYHHLLDTVNIWHYAYNPCGESPGPGGSNNTKALSTCGNLTVRGIVYTSTPMVINGFTYLTLAAESNNYADYIPNDSCFLGFIREDTVTGKVYYLPANGNSEILVYDFSMHVGDTIHYTFINPYDFQTGNYILDSIGTFNSVSGVKKEYFLNCPTCGYNQTLTWIEGVGSLWDVIFPYASNYLGCDFIGSEFTGFQYHMNYFVVCYEHSNMVYSDTAAYHYALAHESPQGGFTVFDSCDYVGPTGGIKQITSLSSFTANPNPANNKVTLTLNVAETAGFDIDVKDVEGKTLNNHLHLGLLNPGLHNTELDISNLSPGFYLIECRTGAGALYSKLVVDR